LYGQHAAVRTEIPKESVNPYTRSAATGIRKSVPLRMIMNKLDLISEKTSPLFRIMWVTNPGDLKYRHFDNNISAFHIGGGLIVSVAHNLRTENHLLKSIDEEIFQNEIFSQLNASHKILFNQSYIPDPASGKRHIQIQNPSYAHTITEALKLINFDTRWLTLTKRKISTPHLIIQFSNGLFYDDPKLTTHFDVFNSFFEASLNRQTFLLKLELVNAFYGSDIAVYRIVDAADEIIKKIPSIEIDFPLEDDFNDRLYCLQSSPAGFLGRLLNKAWLEGYLDHHQVFTDRIGGNYILEGIRYLIRGYFRFGSSGAPYISYQNDSGTFKAIAVQSEASPIQLSINNSREGNFQYVNAIASPLNLVKKEIELMG
jgi:hypothetical protein